MPAADTDLPEPAATCPTVVLRHVLPGGEEHRDWLLARDPAGRGRLVTFRAPRSPAGLEPGDALELERIGDHRPRYLSFQGAIGGGRGSVTRVDAGTIEAWSGSFGPPPGGDVPGRTGGGTLLVRWSTGGPVHRLVVVPAGSPAAWRVTREQAAT